MKRTVLRPAGPGIAATTAQPAPDSPPEKPSDNEITLAVLEQHPGERGKGYDPYNAAPSSADIEAWKRKRNPS